jgi:hypothetical protein
MTGFRIGKTNDYYVFSKRSLSRNKNEFTNSITKFIITEKTSKTRNKQINSGNTSTDLLNLDAHR